MSKGIVFLGGGGHAKSVIDCAISSGEYQDIAIVDKEESKGSFLCGIEIKYVDEDLSKLFKMGYQEAFISVGSIKDNSLRHVLFEKASQHGFEFPNIIDPSAVIARDVSLGKGIFIGKSAVVNSGTSIEDMAIINTGAIIEHDCRVGEYSHISVGAILCGSVCVGKNSFIGAGSTVINNVTIVNDSIIGAGSVVKH